MTGSRLKSIKLWLFLVTAFLLLPFGRAFAADITVGEDCSLYNAILSANGEEQIEPLNSCEDGDEAVDETQTGTDTITLDFSSSD